jgi:hypothetical protein
MGITRRMWSLVLILGLLGLVLVSAGEAAQFNWQQFKGTQLRVMLNKHAWQVAIEPHGNEAGSGSLPRRSVPSQDDR